MSRGGVAPCRQTRLKTLRQKYETISVSPSVCLAAQDVQAAGDHWVKPLRTTVRLVRFSRKEQNRKYSRQQDRQPVGELVACIAC